MSESDPDLFSLNRSSDRPNDGSELRSQPNPQPNPQPKPLSDPKSDPQPYSFRDLQSQLNYEQAQAALQEIVKRLDLSPRERTGVEAEIDYLRRLLDKLEQSVVHIAVFGLVGHGKSSLLNALIGQSVFETGPIHGVTQAIQTAGWQVEQDAELSRVSLPGIGSSRIEFIDTPGIDEVNGEQREALAHQVAQQADLILFVIAGDMTNVEFEALSRLRQASKPLILVFNKVDQYPEADRIAIYETIRDQRVKELLSPDEIVMASASPLVNRLVRRADGTQTVQRDRGQPQIEQLKLKILEILHQEGKSLVALNTMLYADDVNEQLVQRKMTIRDRSADEAIWQATMAKAAIVALNPITAVDMLSGAAIDVALIVTLSRLYGLAMTQRGALDLLKKIALSMGGIGASEMLLTLGLGSLKSLLGLSTVATGGLAIAPYMSVAVAQAGVAGVATYGIGQIVKVYLANGASWGPDGPKTVVSHILTSLDEKSILSRIRSELKAKIEPKRQ